MVDSEESDAMVAPEYFHTVGSKPAESGRSKFLSGLRFCLYFAVVFAAGTAAGWYYVGTQSLTGDDSGIVLVKADKEPVKLSN